jgi:hypothetical protein
MTVVQKRVVGKKLLLLPKPTKKGMNGWVTMSSCDADSKLTDSFDVPRHSQPPKILTPARSTSKVLIEMFA